MLFNSINFLIFFPVVTAMYFLLPYRFRVLWLLAASCYFYMAFIPVFILILAFTITVDYFAGIAIAKAEGRRRKQFLIASIIANVGVLFVFKYFNFFNANIAALADFLHWNYSLEMLSLVLPVGLSFHVFQSLSYTIEVYRGNQKPEKNFLILATYVMFYPQLVAGPIERPQNLLHQFREKHDIDLQRIGDGLTLMVYGFFMKLFIADNLAPFADQVYDHPTEYLAPSFVIATVFFAFQIYCDFAGYSYIAIGSARVMGFRLMNNFRQPYFSRSIGEFWHRWHISLSTWFKDYVYIPLGGSRVTKHLQVRNLLITFLLSGLWHGANWTYVVWGGLNGCYLAMGTFLSRICHAGLDPASRLHLYVWQKKTTNFFKVGPPQAEVRPWVAFFGSLTTIFQTLITFALICLTWVFFRAENIGSAIHIIGQIFTGWDAIPEGITRAEFYRQYIFMGKSDYDFYWALTGIIGLLVVEYCYIKGYVTRMLSAENLFLRYTLRWFLIATALLLIIIFAKTDAQQFIYFQF
jgi:D-alanyl-lipoteichoic acid acyltransferase DltB (MBOAT superfamily)